MDPSPWTYTFYDFVGNLGVFLGLVAYFLLQADRVRAHSPLFLVMNIASSGLILYSLAYDFNLSSILGELFWIAISVYGCLRAGRIYFSDLLREARPTEEADD